MDKKLLNIGIIGFGKMGRIRKKILDERNDCRVSWICDPKDIKERNGSFLFVKDYKKILEDENVDAVFVCTPNYLNKELTIAVLDANKHVFTEKPPGISVTEIEEIIVAKNRNPEKIIKFGFNHRLHDGIIEIRKRIDSKEYGKILWIRGRYGKSVDKFFKNDWRSKRRFSGGGILMDQGIHMLDLFLMFLGELNEVKSFVSNVYWPYDIEDNVFAIFKNTKGQVASLHSTMTQWRYLFSLEIFLEHGYMVLNGILSSSGNYAPEILTISKKRSLPPQAQSCGEEKIVYKNDLSWEREIEEFFTAIRTGSKVCNGTPEDALKLMRVLDMIYKDDK